MKTAKIDLRMLATYIIPEKRNEFVAECAEINSWSYGIKPDAIQDCLVESDIDLLIGTKNAYILHDRKNDTLYSVKTHPIGSGNSLIEHRLDFNSLIYLG